MRVALYYAPLANDPLHAAGANWLGRDPEGGARTAQPAIAGIAELTAEPRVYGFHATLKPPMRLLPGITWPEVAAATEAVARSLAPFTLPLLSVQNLHGFLALRETTPSRPLQALADACVAGLDALRAPPTAEELARRRQASLTAEQQGMLDRWGYPYVFGTWFFHMTLTRRLTEEEHARIHPAAEAYFAQSLTQSRQISEISLFTQAKPGEPFLIAERVPLRGGH